jgi:non-ribosomal peptide synthase protein (TIGR01720 family)
MALDQIAGFGVVPDDRVLQLTSPAFDASMSETFMALLAGATLVMIPVSDITDTDRFADFVERNRVTVITFPPAYLNALNRRPLPTVKTIITAGEPAVPADVLHYAKTKQVFNAYGPTETSVCATFYRVDPHRTYDVVPIGGPIANSSLYVVDDRMNPVPVGVPGELCFSGPGLARGYLNRPALTDEKFVENPFYGAGAPSADRLYRIGDVGAWLPDGTIRFAGRKDDQVKIRGYRIEPGEIKAALMKHPAVDDALVRPGKKDVEGLIAYTVGEAPLTADSLRAFLGEHLPGYMIPARFVRLPRFPLTVHGKVDTAALPAPDSKTDEAVHGGRAPRNPTEAAVAAAWKSVLTVDEVGIFDDFFALGGDSIKAIQAAAKLKQEGFGVSPALFFQHPTIAALSPFVGPAGPAQAQASAPVVGPVPLTGIQTWFFQAFMVDRHHFNHGELFLSPVRIDAQAMERALIRLQEHHDILRTTFRETEVERVGKTIVQETAGVDFPVEFSVFDLTGKADAHEALTHHCNRINASMDLAAGPLMKTALFRMENGDRLFFAIHHLIVDGVSWRILLEDLMSVYAQANKGDAGDPLFLPPKTASFKAWAEQIRNYAENPALLSEIEAWGRLLPERIPPFPSDTPDPVPDTCRSEPGRMKDRGVVSLELDEPVTKTLQTRGNTCFHAKMDEILLTALGAALGGRHEYDATLITLEGHGRETLFPGIDIGRTVGWFTTTYPVLLPHPRAGEKPLAPEGRTATGGIKERIDAVRKVLSQIPNRGFGYNILKYITSKRYTAAAHHAFSVKPVVSFNYLGQYDPYDTGGDGLRLQPATENAGDDVSPHALILHELDFNAIVVQNRLQVVLAYDKTKYRKKTASDIMFRFRTALLEIAEAAEVG